jgi:predicted Zn-dependent peptidase
MYRRAGEGLVAAHAEGIVHRDFKPDNVLVGTDGRPQIVDFGLARASALLDDGDDVAVSGSGGAWRNLDITATGTVLGTPAYMAPEQLARGKPDARSDQFSFCVSLFEALHRRRPFAGSSFTELADNVGSGTMVRLDDHGAVPIALHEIVLRGLSRDPAERHTDMRALLDALERWTRPRIGRSSALLLGGAAIVAAAIGVVALQPRDAAPVPAIEASSPEPVTDPWAEIVAASDPPDTIETADPRDPTAVTVQRLRNGLSIYVAHRPLEPAVSVVLAIRAGPAEEGVDRPGLAMLVQNAVISGTDRLGVVDPASDRALRVFEHAVIESLPSITDPAARAAALASVVASERAGNDLAVLGELHLASRAMGGASTSLIGGNGAQFGARLPINRVGTWLGLAAEAVQRPVFRSFLGRTSDQLAMMTQFDAGDAASRERDAVLAKATGMHDGGAATLEYLASVPLADAKRFHAQWYRPNNAALVFVGDITPAHARQIAEEHFGAWEPAPLPVRARIDAPLPERTAHELVAPGNDGAEIVWPMPPMGTPDHERLEVLASVLGGRSGLLHVVGAGRAQALGVHIGEARDFRVIASPREGQTAAEAEQVAIDALREIAEDRVDDAVWAAALADSELGRLSWARGPSSLTHVLLKSFLGFESWTETHARMTAGPPTRAEVIAAAKLLLQRGRHVTLQRSGDLAPREAPTLPPSTSTWVSTPRSELALAAIATPVPPMEPRFLVAGSSYTEMRHGAGRVITTQTDSPLFHLSWIFPIGTEEDPWACDAVRASLLFANVPGTYVDVFCTPADTRVNVVGVAERFDEIMPQLHEQVLAADAKMNIEMHVGLVARNRPMHARMSFFLVESAEQWALFGDAAVDAKLPPTRALKSSAAQRLPIARDALAKYDPDVLYVGPDPDALVAALPPATGLGSPGPVLRRYRALDPAKPRVFVMDDPSRQGVSVRALVPWFAETPREHLAASIHREVVGQLEEKSQFAVDDESSRYDAKWSPGVPLAIGVAFRVEPAQTDEALEAASAILRERPSPDAFAAAHRVLEAGFRSHRPIPLQVPQLVYSWPPESSDPRVAQWLALPSLGHDDLAAYYDRVDRQPPVLVVVGDLRAIDLDALGRLGEVVRGDADTIILDASQAYRRDDSDLMNE